MYVLSRLYMLFLLHCIGDYFLQTDYLAKTKGANWYHLAIHCVFYILPFVAAFGFDLRTIVIFITHFVIDALKARYSKINYATDQILHIVIILLLYL